MKTLTVFLVSILFYSTAATTVAQAPADEARNQEERARLESERAQSRAQLEAARAELDAVRKELERRAQEVARLSAEQYRSLAGQYARSAGRELPNGNYTFYRHALLGLNINNDEDGVRVSGLSPGGPGDESGVEIGDLIVTINDVEVDGSAGANPSRRFLEVLNEVEAGSEVELELLRDGEPMTLLVQTSESRMPAWVGDIGEHVNVVVRDIPRIADRTITRVMEQPFFFGGWRDIELVELTPGLGEYFGTENGLLVVRAPEEDDVELRDGDVILEISGREPQSVGHAMRILRSFEPDESLEITIMREQRRQTLEIEIPAAGNDFTVEID